MKKTIFTTTYNGKTIEKLIGDPEIMINHFIFRRGEGLPVHNSNSNVYMIILKGTLSLKLDGLDASHTSGQILTIPYGKSMNVRNENDDILEMFVLKAPPHPDQYGL